MQIQEDQKYTVLIADDDQAIRQLLAKMVKKAGYETLVAEDGEQAIQIFRQHKVDILLSDLKMPKMDGLELIRQIKKIAAETQIILITAYGQTEVAIAALQYGVLDYIKKPLEIDQLFVSLGRAKENLDKINNTRPFPVLLLAEDEQIARNRLQKVLMNEGWKVLIAQDGQEAIEIFRQEKIDLVLMDIKMPRKTGLQALHEMKQDRRDFEAIFLTGFGDESFAIQAMRDGAYNFLKKPVDLDQLFLHLDKALEKLNLHRALVYRQRELDLTNQLMIKLGGRKEVMLDLGDYLKQPIIEFAQEILDFIPVGLVVVDQSLKVKYVNRLLESLVGLRPQELDLSFIDGLSKIGIADIDGEKFIKMVQTTFSQKIGYFEKFPISEYAFISIIKVMMSERSKYEQMILLIIRGERAHNPQ